MLTMFYRYIILPPHAKVRWSRFSSPPPVSVAWLSAIPPSRPPNVPLGGRHSCAWALGTSFVRARLLLLGVYGVGVRHGRLRLSRSGSVTRSSSLRRCRRLPSALALFLLSHTVCGLASRWESLRRYWPNRELFVFALKWLFVSAMEQKSRN